MFKTLAAAVIGGGVLVAGASAASADQIVYRYFPNPTDAVSGSQIIDADYSPMVISAHGGNLYFPIQTDGDHFPEGWFHNGSAVIR